MIELFESDVSEPRQDVRNVESPSAAADDGANVRFSEEQ